MEAETRDLGAGGFASLQQRIFRRDIDFDTVNDELCHLIELSSSTRAARCASRSS
jgi:hypothetical protein